MVIEENTLAYWKKPIGILNGGGKQIQIIFNWNKFEINWNISYNFEFMRIEYSISSQWLTTHGSCIIFFFFFFSNLFPNMCCVCVCLYLASVIDHWYWGREKISQLICNIVFHFQKMIWINTIDTEWVLFCLRSNFVIMQIHRPKQSIYYYSVCFIWGG